MAYNKLLTELAFGTVKHEKTSQVRSVLQDLGLNILLYEKQTRLINSNYYMTNSYRPGLKKFDWFKAGL